MRTSIIVLGMLCLAYSSAALAGGQMTFGYGGVEGFCLDAYANSFASYDLHLVDPTNPSFDNGGEQAVTHIGGFECKVVPQEGVIIMSVDFPVPSINVGDERGMIVGFGEPVPVDGSRIAVLATVNVFFTNDVSYDLLESSNFPCYHDVNTGMGVKESYPASIPGSVAFIDADDPDTDPLAPAETSLRDLDIRMFQDPVVDTENNAWGQIKAIYR